MESTEEPGSIRETAQKALQANKVHQYALKVYTERLEAELRTIDRLLGTADVEDEDDEPELDAGGYVTVPNSERVVFPIPANEFLSPDSPFHEDAEKRNRYISHTASHPMKPKELESLAEAVRTENHRKRALEAQTGGLPTLAPRDGKDFFEWNTDGIDWSRVAEKVSTVANFPRTAQDCAIRWLGDHHPKFVHSPWTAAEISKVQSLVKAAPKGPINWVEIAENLGTHRTPLDCMRHGMPRKVHTWTPESDSALLSAIKIYGINNWALVASHVSEDAEPKQCRARYERTLDPSIQRGSWTVEEDERLRLAVKAYGHSSWADVAEVIPGRTNEQCRDRWQDNLNPSLAKGKWTPEEDEMLKDAVNALGVSSWKAISERMGNGRNDNNCRTHYNALIKQKKKPPKAPASENMDTAHSQPEAGPSTTPARSRRPQARKHVLTDAGSEQEREQEVEQPVARPRPKPKPKSIQVPDEDVLVEPAEGDERHFIAPSLVSENGKGKKRDDIASRKRKTGEEGEFEPPTKKRRGRKAASVRDECSIEDNREDETDMNAKVVSPPKSKRGSPSKQSVAQIASTSETAMDTRPEQDGIEDATLPTQLRVFPSNSRTVSLPTRRQPPRNAYKKK